MFEPEVDQLDRANLIDRDPRRKPTGSRHAKNDHELLHWTLKNDIDRPSSTEPKPSQTSYQSMCTDSSN